MIKGPKLVDVTSQQMARVDSRSNLEDPRFLKDKISFDILISLDLTFFPDLRKSTQTSPQKLDLEAQSCLLVASS